MKTLKSALCVLTVLAYFHASAGEQEAYEDSLDLLGQKAEKLSRQSGAQCAQNHAAMFAGKQVRISMFFGYDDGQGISHDRPSANAMAEVLAQPCRGNLAACGFFLSGGKDNYLTLEKRVSGKNVQLRIYWSTAEDKSKQDEFKAQVRAQFNQELVASNAVFYMGHSRGGGGLGLGTTNNFKNVLNLMFRMPVKSMISAMSSAQSKVKFVGLFGCDTEKHYRADMEAARPDLSMVVTGSAAMSDESQEAMLGTLNGLLAKKCSGDIQRSMSRNFKYIAK